MEKGNTLVLIVILAALISLPITFMIEEELFEANLHVSAMVLSLMVIVVGYKSKTLFGGTIGEGLNYIFLGMVALAAIHFSELATEIFNIIKLEGKMMETLEHTLFYIGMILILYGFLKIGRFLEKMQLAK